MAGSCTEAWTVPLDYIPEPRPHQLSVEGCIFSGLLSTDLTSGHLKIFFSNSLGAGNKFLSFLDSKSSNQRRRNKLLTLGRMEAQLCFVLVKLMLSIERKFSSPIVCFQDIWEDQTVLLQHREKC